MEITPEGDQLIDTNEDREAIFKKRKRSSSINFEMIGIPPGTVLTFSKDHNRECIVVDQKKVEFNGEVQSLSKAALTVLHDLGYEWQTANGWAHWCYKGERITDYLNNLNL
ncbi:MAG: hypothetical protein ACN4E2_06000 [Nitrospinota bacterium]